MACEHIDGQLDALRCNTSAITAIVTCTNLAELLYTVRAKGDKARTSRRGLHSLDCIIGGWVRPEQVHQQHPALLHGKRPLQLINLLYLLYATPNACNRQACQPASHAVVHYVILARAGYQQISYSMQLHVARWPTAMPKSIRPFQLRGVLKGRVLAEYCAECTMAPGILQRRLRPK